MMAISFLPTCLYEWGAKRLIKDGVNIFPWMGGDTGRSPVEKILKKWKNRKGLVS
jgi:hypothetical protein